MFIIEHQFKFVASSIKLKFCDKHLSFLDTELIKKYVKNIFTNTNQDFSSCCVSFQTCLPKQGANAKHGHGCGDTLDNQNMLDRSIHIHTH